MGRRPKDAAAGRGGKDRPRQKNTGGKYQRADGRWGGSFTRHAGDRTWTERTTRPTEEAINEWLTEQRHLEALGAAPQDKSQTVAQFLTYWLAHGSAQRLRASTFATYSSHVTTHLIPQLGRHRLANLSPQYIESALNRLLREPAEATGKPLAPRTVKDIHAILVTALNQAVKLRLITSNPATAIDPPRVPRRKMNVLTPADAKLLIAAVQGARQEALFTVALSLGLRRGEALGLRWEDVDLDRGVLRVRQSIQRIAGRKGLQVEGLKSDAALRSINLPAVTLGALRRHKARQNLERQEAGAEWEDSGLVFVSQPWRGRKGGHALDPRNYKRIVDAALEKAGLAHVRIHELRHTAASIMLAMGVAPKMVSEILGHSRIGITLDLYGHLFEPERAAAAHAVDRALGGGNEPENDAG